MAKFGRLRNIAIDAKLQRRTPEGRVVLHFKMGRFFELAAGGAAC
ncbi:MAG TPA: hypothetical protein VLL05_03500 [Terriglobales bacterium]|nr:hypothetical protein [Terriglobales bacterium]